MLNSTSRRLPLLAVVAGLAVGIAACGDSGEADPSGSTAPENRTSTSERAAEEPDGSVDRTAREGADGTGSGDGARDSEDRGGDPAPPDGGSVGGSEPATEEERAMAVATEMYADLARADAEGVCAAMSRAVRREIADNVLGGSGASAQRPRTCAASFAVFLDAAATSGVLESTLRARVSGARIDGDRARVTVAIDGKAGDVELVKENGEWRFGTPPTKATDG